uniref:G-protein coupled receptors family 1 profile domain-containing protein n=1 Tax=Plectus sambesii TaxID=2011161 RepID=A0A914UH58_9BILA
MLAVTLAWIVFVLVEFLGIVGFLTNVFLIITIVRWKHYRFPSFLIIGSLAVADTYHCLHTSTYFYPPIVNLGTGSDPLLGWILVMNALDWTAWGITLTHMIGLSFDRFLAIVKYNHYKLYVTSRRVALLIAAAWAIEGTLALVLASTQSCCPMVPKPDLLSFDFIKIDRWTNKTGIVHTVNWYSYVYMPQEVIAMFLLLVLNPISVLTLYRRSKKAAGLCSSSGRRFRRDLRVYLQIGVVIAVFFAYMTAYYLTINLKLTNRLGVTLFNSLLYNINNMINPLVYVTINKHLRAHFWNTISFGLIPIPRRRRVDSLASPCASRRGTIVVRPERSETLTSVSSA